MTSWVVVALVWKWLLNPQFGFVNRILGVFGIHGPGWWLDPARKASQVESSSQV